MTIEPWQMPILVMAGIILAELLAGVVRRRWRDEPAKQWIRVLALGGLAVLVIVVGVMALGPDLADQIASVAAAVAGVVALWLTFRAYQLQAADQERRRPADPDRNGPT